MAPQPVQVVCFNVRNKSSLFLELCFYSGILASVFFFLIFPGAHVPVSCADISRESRSLVDRNRWEKIYYNFVWQNNVILQNNTNIRTMEDSQTSSKEP